MPGREKRYRGGERAGGRVTGEGGRALRGDYGRNHIRVQSNHRNKLLPVSQRAMLALVNMPIWKQVTHIVKHTCRNSFMYIHARGSLTAAFQRRVVTLGQVENSLGQPNPSLVYHWQNPLQTIITVSFNPHMEDIKTEVEYAANPLSLSHTHTIGFCLWSLVFILSIFS